MGLAHTLELVHLHLELKQLLVAAARHRPEQLVFLLGVLEERNHRATVLGQLGVLLVGVADLFVGLGPGSEHVYALCKECVQGFDVVGDGALQVVDHGVVELLDGLLYGGLDRRGGNCEAVDFDFALGGRENSFFLIFLVGNYLNQLK